MSTLVLDASYAVTACHSADGFTELDEHDLVAPPLMWSEARSTIRQTHWRGEVAKADALAQILNCRLITIDGNLRRGTDRLDRVITPDEL